MTEEETGINPDALRREAIYVSGVDDLSSRNIKLYLDHYLKDSVVSADQRINKYVLEWINDSSLNVVFEDEDSCKRALILLCSNYEETIDFGENNYEREAKTFYYEGQELAPKPDAPEVRFQIRLATNGDKKSKNAKDESRYYLLHGEPDRKYRPRGRGGRYNNSRRNYRNTDYRQRDEPDLFANKLPSLVKPSSADVEMDDNVEDSSEINAADDEEDLFPNFKPKTKSAQPEPETRSRSRSPSHGSSGSGKGLFDRVGRK